MDAFKENLEQICMAASGPVETVVLGADINIAGTSHEAPESPKNI